MRFFTSDTHFGHANIIRYCDRPFKDVSHMNEAIIERWNSVVSNDDTVYHLGDVALGPWDQWDSVLTRLNGHKILIVGNHDRIFAGESEKHRERFTPVYTQWFGALLPDLTVDLENGHTVNLSHFPYEADHMDKARYMEFRLPDKGRTLIHGHTHLDSVISRSNAGTLQIHVGQDAWDFTPVSEDQIIALVEGLK